MVGSSDSGAVIKLKFADGNLLCVEGALDHVPYLAVSLI